LQEGDNLKVILETPASKAAEAEHHKHAEALKEKDELESLKAAADEEDDAASPDSSGGKNQIQRRKSMQDAIRSITRGDGSILTIEQVGTWRRFVNYSVWPCIAVSSPSPPSPSLSEN
jgi:hypothetical protein